MSLETRLDGDPGAICAVSAWLNGTLGEAADTAATSALQQRSRMASAWEGAAGDAFGGRATALGRACDDLQGQTGRVAGDLDALAAALRTAQTGLAQVRREAAAAGLTVTGTVIHEPTPVARPAPLVDGTPADAARHDEALQRYDRYQELVVAWNKAVRDAEEYVEDWQQALDRAASTWRDHDADLLGLAQNLMVGAASATLVYKLAPVLAGEAAEQLRMARQLAEHADDMLKDGRLLAGTADGYYDLLDRSAAADARAAQYAEAAKDPKLPKGIKAAGGALGVLTMGYGIHDDLQNGESTEQAVASNVGGTLAGIGAGAASGAAIGAGVGTLVPVPGVGTAAGAIGGAVVGTGVGIVTSGAIDSAFENGVDGAGDVVDAVDDGIDELGDKAGDLADMGGDLVGGIL